jgi:hypothetical protein
MRVNDEEFTDLSFTLRRNGRTTERRCYGTDEDTFFMYKGINVGNGWSKRLYGKNSDGKTVRMHTVTS